jgi:hypothetical protein
MFLTGLQKYEVAKCIAMQVDRETLYICSAGERIWENAGYRR